MSSGHVCAFAARYTAGAAIIGSVLISALPAAAEQPWPGEVVADYKISFAGFDIGWFRFHSRVAARNYALAGSAKLSLMFGGFKWRAESRSTGETRGRLPDPRAYAFEYQANSKRGRVNMGFRGGNVSALALQPNTPPSSKAVPLRKHHLASVFDPLSAVMALTKGGDANPCRKRLAIFDGKQRFDLQFSFAGHETIYGTGGRNGPVRGFVCRVKYIPIAGYKPSQGVSYMARTNGIKVIMRPVPVAGLFVPHEIRVPTMAGDAVLVARRVAISDQRKQRIALFQ